MAVMDITGNPAVLAAGYRKILIEPWGKDGLRVRVTRNGSFDGKIGHWKIAHGAAGEAEIYETAPPNFAQDAARLGQGEYQFNEKPEKKPNAMRIVNGDITAEIDPARHIRFLNGKGERAGARICAQPQRPFRILRAAQPQGETAHTCARQRGLARGGVALKPMRVSASTAWDSIRRIS